jgi:hypothetical protein
MVPGVDVAILIFPTNLTHVKKYLDVSPKVKCKTKSKDCFLQKHLLGIPYLTIGVRSLMVFTLTVSGDSGLRSLIMSAVRRKSVSFGSASPRIPPTLEQQ